METNHKLVKTTPKPKATKNKRGELVGPLFPPPLSLFWRASGVDVGADMVGKERLEVAVARKSLLDLHRTAMVRFRAKTGRMQELFRRAPI